MLVFMNDTANRRGFAFWALQGPGWLMLLYLVIAQGISAISYDLGVVMGTQEPAEVVTEVGKAFWYGFAFADILIYIPLLLAGLIGHFRQTRWGRTALAAALGITVYWPVVCLAALVKARGATGWELSNEGPYWIVLTSTAIWGAWGLYTLLRDPRYLHEHLA